jgi:hypothetical protein
VSLATVSLSPLWSDLARVVAGARERAQSPTAQQTKTASPRSLGQAVPRTREVHESDAAPAG